MAWTGSFRKVLEKQIKCTSFFFIEAVNILAGLSITAKRGVGIEGRRQSSKVEILEFTLYIVKQ